jgi:hypothetical protein
MLFDASFTESQIVSVEPKGFLVGLESVLSKTSSRTLANYIGWKLVEEYLDGNLIQKDDSVSRWEWCVTVS